MRKLLKVSCLILLIFFIASCSEETPINEIPMYGGAQFTEAQIRCNEEFINSVVKQSGSRQAAAREVIKLGWQYFHRNDPRTAMKRFNQAWLLDQNNADAYYGFGHLSSVRGETDRAIGFYKKAIEINPNLTLAIANLARSYKDKAYALYRKKRIKFPDAEVKKILSQAFPLYEKAIQTKPVDSNLRVSDLDEDLSYIYYEWAIALEFNGEYEKAWEKIRLSRKHGGDKIIEPGFIKELSGCLPEPK